MLFLILLYPRTSCASHSEIKNSKVNHQRFHGLKTLELLLLSNFSTTSDIYATLQLRTAANLRENEDFFLEI
jgi:hypothetical protein